MQVLIPVKDLHSSKSRLAHALPTYARPALMSALLADLLTELRACRLVSDIALITRCPEAAKLATAHAIGVLSLPDDRDLNSGVQAAVTLKTQEQASAVMILHGDLPLATANGIDDVIHRHQQSGCAVSLVPDSQHNGTNVMLLSLPTAITFQYGVQSYQQHHDHCTMHNIAAQTITSETLGCDLDLWQDFAPLLSLRTTGNRPHLMHWFEQYGELFNLPLAANF